MNLTLIATVVSAVAGFAVAWQLQAHQIVKQELSHANERISIQRAARATIERTSNAVIQAQNAAAGRVAVLKRQSDAAVVAADGLREQIDITQRASATTIDACNRYSIAIGGLLNQCATRYRELGNQAQGHVSDIRTLMAAWPKE
jgi:hypothetical protein